MSDTVIIQRAVESGIDWSNIVSALIALLAAGTGVYAVDNWKREFRARARHEIARKIVRAVIDVREGFRTVRNPFMSAQELAHALKEAKVDVSAVPLESDEASKHAYNLRLQELGNAFRELRVAILEAEAELGSQFREAHYPLWALRATLVTNLTGYFRTLKSKRPLAEERAEQIDNILYDHSTQTESGPKPDEFQQKVETECDKLFVLAQDYLAWKRSAPK